MKASRTDHERTRPLARRTKSVASDIENSSSVVVLAGPGTLWADDLRRNRERLSSSCTYLYGMDRLRSPPFRHPGGRPPGRPIRADRRPPPVGRPEVAAFLGW